MTHRPGATNPLPTRELRRRLGSLHQLAGIDMVTAEDGLERGVRKALVRTGSGLEYSVHVDRGFDIGEVRFNGINMTWRSPVGATQPPLHQDDPQGWLRRFPGGLLTTCGLDNVGPASQDRPMHGRYSQIPSQLLSSRTSFEGDRYVLELVGQIRQYKLFGEHLVLTRTIRSAYGSNVIHIQDTVENQAFEKAPLLLLYHCNFGYPLLDESTLLRLESDVTPRDEAAQKGLGTYKHVHAPQEGYREQVFFHDPKADDHGLVTVGLSNPALLASVFLHYLKDQIPYLTQWKQLGEGAYVLGIEPGTCRVLGFDEEAEAGRVLWLEPGETHSSKLLFEFSTEPVPVMDGATALEMLT
jgi:galactose mutarotase-like enzyme